MATPDELGCRSRLVLEKLGFDLRPYLDTTLNASLPGDIQKLADELMGYAEWRDVGMSAKGHPPDRQRPEPVRQQGWDIDQPFRFPSHG